MTVTCPCSSTTKCHVNLFVYNNNNNNNNNNNERVYKSKAYNFSIAAGPFAIFLEDLVKISSAVLEISGAKINKKIKIKVEIT